MRPLTASLSPVDGPHLLAVRYCLMRFCALLLQNIVASFGMMISRARNFALQVVAVHQI